jgi:hypothetical protein
LLSSYHIISYREGKVGHFSTIRGADFYNLTQTRL